MGADGRAIREWKVHAGQGRILSSDKRIIVVPCGRRWGKSEVAAMWLGRTAQRARLAGKKGKCWVVFPTYELGKIAWEKFLKVLPVGWVTTTYGTAEKPGSIYLGNVVIEFKSGVKPERLVGEGVLALWVDECGTIPERVWVESLRPTMIDHRAPALLTGTPKGHNWFYRLFVQGQDPLYPNVESLATSSSTGMPSFDNPFVPREEIEDLAREMTARLYSQEILAEFLSDQGAVFKRVRAAVEKVGGQLCTEHPTASLGVDLARRLDFTVLVGMCREFHVTFFDRFKDIDWPIQKAKIEAAYERLQRPMVVMDQTGVGDPIVQDLQAAGMMVEGFQFTQQSRTPLIEGLIIAFDNVAIGLPDEPVLVNELEAFDLKQLPSGRTTYRAPEGAHDDCVMALALAYRGAYRYGDLGVTLGA